MTRPGMTIRSVARRSATAAALAALGWSLAAAAQDAPAGDAAAGKQLFVRDGCYECHGYVGQGAYASGPRLVQPILPFEAFLAQLRSPANVMPPYLAGVLSDHDAASIYAYLGAQPAPPPLKDIAILNH